MWIITNPNPPYVTYSYLNDLNIILLYDEKQQQNTV